MRSKLCMSVILLVLIGSLAMPLTGAADSGKAVIKQMVQSPEDYSVALMPWDYLIPGDRYYRDIGDFPRNMWTGFRLYRLMPPLDEIPRDAAPN